jgi:hypothetical protein
LGQQTFVDGQVLTGAEAMAIPQGLLASCNNSGAQVISTTSAPGTAVTGMSITVTLASNRNIRLRAIVSGVFSSASASATVAIYEGSTELGATNFGAGSTSTVDDGVVDVILATGILGTSPSAGAHTYVVKMWCSTGTVTLQTGTVDGIFTCDDV